MAAKEDIKSAIIAHLRKQWNAGKFDEFVWTFGPIAKSVPHFRVVRVSPVMQGDPWVYISCGAWHADTSDGYRKEFFLLSPYESPAHVETLAMIANFHADPTYEVKLGSVIDIGRPWMDDAVCDHLLISLPYPLGPSFEFLRLQDKSLIIRFLWLMPITDDEARFSTNKGVEELEYRFESAGVNYLDKNRPSVVGAG